MVRYIIQVTLLVFLVVHPVFGQPLKPLSTQNGIANEVKGVWENPRKGWRLDIQDHSISLYNYTEDLCFKDKMDTEELQGLMRYYQRQEDVLTVSLRAENSTAYFFDHLEALPEACSQEVQGTPTEAFTYFSDLMAQYYPFFDLYGVDWDKRRAEYEPRVSDDMSDKALFEVLTGMLEGVKDGHVALLGIIDGEYEHFSPTRTRELGPNLDSLYYKQRKVKEVGLFHHDWFLRNMKAVHKKVLDRKGQRDAVDEAVVWGRIGTIGYIKIRSMEGYSGSDSFSLEGEISGAHAAISEAIKDLADTESLIIDVAFNRGGLDEVSLAIASHFTDERRMAYTKAAYRSSRSPQPIYVEPAAEVLYLKPIALVTSEITVSAAEIFTMAMRALPQVTHYGEATFGALSDILPKPLPNGWELGMSNERYEDADGKFWEGRGVLPHNTIKLFDPSDIYNSYPNALLKVADLLEEQNP